MWKKIKGVFSKLVIVLVIVLNVWFTKEVLEVFKVTGSEPAALVAAWFAFTTGELWMLASIKKCKTKHKKEDIDG